MKKEKSKLFIYIAIIVSILIAISCSYVGYKIGFEDNNGNVDVSDLCNCEECDNNLKEPSEEPFDFDESVIVKDKTIISELYSIIGISEKDGKLQDTEDCSLNYYLTQYYLQNDNNDYLESLIIELFGNNQNYFETPSDSVLSSKDCEENNRCKFISFNNAKNIMEKYSFLTQEKKYFKSSKLVKDGYLFIESNYPYANLFITKHNTIVVKDASVDKELFRLIDNQTRYDGEKIVNKWQFHYVFSKNNNGNYVLDYYYIEY